MSVSGEQGCSSSSSAAAAGSVVQVCFPSIRTAVLENLNRQREDGRLCDLSIQVQGQVFRAHRCVLAASSPYFHDQVLLKNMSTVSIPAVMDPLAFESVLSCAYTGELRMLRDDIVNYLTVGSVLQMWHIVDKCTELLKEGRGGGGASQDAGGQSSRPVQSHPDPQPPTRPNMNESQSPSSTNYFSPREAGPSGGGASGEAAAANSTPSYCTPSGGDEGFLIGEDEEEEEELLYPRKQERGSRRRKKSSSAPDQESGVSDSFGVSSYQDGEPSPSRKRPAYIQPSIVPRKQWVVVKKERPQEDELIVVSGEEGGEEDEEIEAERDRERTLNISNVRTLSMEMSNRAEADMEPQDYCQEDSEDYLKFESDLMDQGAGPLTQGSLSNGRPVATLVQSGATRHQLFPLDMQGNQILVYSQGPVDATSVTGGVSLKGVGLEHGAVHLGPGGGGLDGLDGAGGSSGGKVFMCHCGKTFTHKSMRDRHVNMHLDLRPFHCPICSKKFKMKHHLTEHMKTHTGLKPYDCHSCGKKFMWRDSFMRHRSHCERRGGGVVSDGGGAGVDGGALIGGRAGIPVLSPHHSAGGLAVPGALLGVSSHSLSSAVFGLGAGRASCEEEVCEVGESSVT